ncbi:MAG: hypothetical protein GX340_04775 [Clostridiales bacterium]|jgi:hypothetical protein|nr:hypothetical protein [Clostridiales bacterium]
MIRIIECCVCKRMTRANLLLWDTNICLECEQKIIDLDSDHEDYLVLKEGIKRILRYNQPVSGP